MDKLKAILFIKPRYKKLFDYRKSKKAIQTNQDIVIELLR